MTSLSVLIPTPAAPRPLKRCLNSIRTQPLRPGDEVLVIIDTHDFPVENVRVVTRTVEYFGPPFRSLTLDAGAHDHGHAQLNLGLEEARGEWITVNDDDDVFVPGAFNHMRNAIESLPDGPQPLMFKFIPWFRQIVWAKREIVFQEIGGHCLVTPNLPDRVGRFTSRYEGDYDWIRSTVDLWPNKDADVVWCPEIISLARPDQ